MTEHGRKEEDKGISFYILDRAESVQIWRSHRTSMPDLHR